MTDPRGPRCSPGSARRSGRQARPRPHPRPRPSWMTFGALGDAESWGLPGKWPFRRSSPWVLFIFSRWGSPLPNPLVLRNSQGSRGVAEGSQSAGSSAGPAVGQRGWRAKVGTAGPRAAQCPVGALRPPFVAVEPVLGGRSGAAGQENAHLVAQVVASLRVSPRRPPRLWPPGPCWAGR